MSARQVTHSTSLSAFVLPLSCPLMQSHYTSPFPFASHGGAFNGPLSRAPSPDSPASQRPPPHQAPLTHHSYPTSASPATTQPHHRLAVLALSGKPIAVSPASFGPPSASASASATSALPSPGPVGTSTAAQPVDYSPDTSRAIRARMELLERENVELKRSVLELGVAYNRALLEVKERWKAAVRAAGTGGQAALTAMDAVGVISLSNSTAEPVAASEGTERRERERQRSASPAVSSESSKLTAANGIAVGAGEEDEEDEMHIERVFSSGSSGSSTSQLAHSRSHARHHHSHHHSAAASASSTPPSRLFKPRLDLLGHTGAVYALSVDGDGRLVASAGMDKTIRVWDMHAILASSNASLSSSSTPATPSSSARYQLLSLSAHSLNISSLAFALTASSNSSSSPCSSAPLQSAHLISASFDKTVAFHDLSTGTTVRSVDVGSFATSLAPSSLSGGSLCYVGTTGKRMLTLDRRAGSIVASWDNDTMVSAVSILSESSSETQVGGGDEQLLTGDHGGHIRTWSRRMQRPIHSQTNDSHNKPISHLHCLRSSTQQLDAAEERIDKEEEDSNSDQRTLFATNSFDDVLRVYDSRRDGGADKAASDATGTANGATDDFQLLYELKGVKNQNWPIKSSFYRGKEWLERQQWMELNELLSSSSSGSSSSSSPPSSPSSPHSHSSPSSDDERPDRGSSAPATSLSGRVVDVTTQDRPRQRPSSAAAAVPFSLPHSRLLASGSADGCVYVFDVTAGGSNRGRGSVSDASGGGTECGSRLLQRLEGHRDRVYTCMFHPVEPVLFSAGADATVKVWTASKAWQ